MLLNYSTHDNNKIMPTRSNAKMTEKQWQQTLDALDEASARLPGPAMSDESLDMARSCLVEGRSQASVAEDYGITRQSVQHLVSRIYKLYREKVVGFPDNWKEVVICGSPDLIKKVKKLEKEEHEKYLKQ